MPFFCLIRPEAEGTFCNAHVDSGEHIYTKEAVSTFGRKYDLIADAIKIAGGLARVCPECLTKRRFPWPTDHGHTSEDEWADDDENWRALDAAAREKTVD